MRFYRVVLSVLQLLNQIGQGDARGSLESSMFETTCFDFAVAGNYELVKINTTIKAMFGGMTVSPLVPTVTKMSRSMPVPDCRATDTNRLPSELRI